MPLLAEKAALRRQLRQLRQGIPPEERARAAQAAARVVCALPEFVQAHTVLLYLATGEELETAPILQEALRLGKTVGVPRCEGPGQMRFYRYLPEHPPAPGAYGILEPDAACCPPVTRWEGSLCITPGLAYDRTGHRLGYGGGYYDRFFAGYSGIRLGLCYQRLLLPALPTGPDDRPVELVVTEDGGFRV